MDLIKTMREEQHAILLISHNLETVFDLSDRIVVLRHGTKIADLVKSETNKQDVVSLLTSGAV